MIVITDYSPALIRCRSVTSDMHLMPNKASRGSSRDLNECRRGEDEMEHDLISTSWQLGIRLSDPLKFRFILQPAMAICLAVRGGLKDAKDGKLPYFWALLTGNAAERWAELKNGRKSMGKLIITATVMDAIYQTIADQRVYPGGSSASRVDSGCRAIPTGAGTHKSNRSAFEQYHRASPTC
jgi:hypothetical protein